MLTDEPLVIGQRQIDQEDNHCEHDEIQGDLEEPFVAPATGPVADARGDAEKQEERRDQQVPDAANHPEHVAAVVVTQRLWRRFRDIDSCGSVDPCRGRSAGGLCLASGAQRQQQENDEQSGAHVRKL